MLSRRWRTSLIAAVAVAGVVGSSRPADAQMMIRGFAAGMQATCYSATTADSRELLWGGDIGAHTRFIELTFGGIASNCAETEILGNFGAVLFPIHIGRFYAGGGAHYDFNDPNVRGYLRPEGAIGFVLQHDVNNTRDRDGNLIRQNLDGFAIDARIGIYQARSWYAAVGLAYYFSSWHK
jgi:hypothetical protein